MRVFLSYASEDRDLARPIVESIRARRHTVFFDRTDLPPGETYEDQIQDAVARAELMVFLITPDSVSPGRFPLTELRFARAKWSRAAQRVLPVMLRPTPLNTVPEYLRLVTILEPQGNVAAEVAAEVDRITRRFQRLLKRATVALFAAGLMVIGLYWLLAAPVADFSLKIDGPRTAVRGYFGKPDIHRIEVIVSNNGRIGAELHKLSIESQPPGSLDWRVVRSDLGSESPVPPDGESRTVVHATVKDTELRWRACVAPKDQRMACGPFEKWNPTGSAPYADRMPLDDLISVNATAVAWDGSAFLVAITGASSANAHTGKNRRDKIVRLDESGAVLASAELAAIPTAISVGRLGLFVGLGGPVNGVARLHKETLARLDHAKIIFPKALTEALGAPISTRPVDLAQTETHLWVLTSGGASAEGIGFFDQSLSEFQVPVYYDNVSFDLSGMRLHASSKAIWTGTRDVSPASIHRLMPSDHTRFGGHDFEIASCASDVLVLHSTRLGVPDCRGRLQTVLVDGNGLALGRRIGSLEGYRSTSATWETVSLTTAPSGTVVGGLTTRLTPPMASPERYSVDVSLLNPEAAPRLILSMTGGQLVDLAIGNKTLLALLEGDDGRNRQLVAPALPTN